MPLSETFLGELLKESKRNLTDDSDLSDLIIKGSVGSYRFDIFRSGSPMTVSHFKCSGCAACKFIMEVK